MTEEPQTRKKMMGRDDTSKCQYCSAQVQELALGFHEDNCSHNPANMKDDDD